MDDEEIDAWYEEQKDKITEEYKKNIDRTKNPEKLKQEYLNSLENIRKKYERRSDHNTKYNLKKFFLIHTIEKIKAKLFKPFNLLQERLQSRKRQKPE